MKNLYDVLGIDTNANNADIKQAYKSLAMKLHPDRGGDESSFKLLEQAYRVLSDDDKRKQYDSTGSVGTVKTIDDKATDVLSQLFNEVIKVGFVKGDIISHVRAIVLRNKSSLDGNLVVLNNRVDRLIERSGRLSTDDEINIFQILIDQHLEEAKLRMAKTEENITILLTVDNMLDNYVDNGSTVKKFEFFETTTGY